MCSKANSPKKRPMKKSGAISIISEIQKRTHKNKIYNILYNIYISIIYEEIIEYNYLFTPINVYFGRMFYLFLVFETFFNVGLMNFPLMSFTLTVNSFIYI